MFVEVDEAAVQAAYEKIYELALAENASRAFVARSKRYVEGHWHRYKPKIGIFRRPLHGGVFVDYGSKFGHLVPLLTSQQVDKVYCLDVKDEYLKEGPNFIGRIYDVEFQKTRQCLVKIPSNSVDFVLTNEVISHINPDYLENFYREVARILKPGGEIAISDGNNLAHLPTRLTLIEWYERWENGPGSKELGDSCYRLQREEIIRSEFSGIGEEQARYLAANTSGLWGDALLAAADEYLRGGEFVERPYRPGICPTRPLTGVMMERGFFPEEVERALVLHGIDAVQVDRGKAIGGPSDRGRTKNFTIRGTKLAEDVQTLLEYAEADHARHYGSSEPPETLSPAGIDEPPRNNGDAAPTDTRAKPGTRKFAKEVLRRITGRA